MKKIVILIVSACMLVSALAGCGSDDTVQAFIVSNTKYTDNNKLESAKQGKSVKANQAVYASVYLIESPKGMEYTINWYLDDMQIKSETLKIQGTTKDLLVYELEADKATKGRLKVDVVYKETVLSSRVLSIQ